MKYKKWIIAALIISAIAFLLLYPLKPDLNGTWFVQRISTNGKEYNNIAPGHYHLLNKISGNRMNLLLSSRYSIEAEIAMPYRDTLLIRSNKDTLLNGRYKMTIDTVLKTHLPYSTGFPTVRVKLKSKNKIFEFSKSLPQQGSSLPKSSSIPRGRP